MSPTAVISDPDPKYIGVDQWIKLEGNGSYDPDGSIVKYEWDFDFTGTFDCDYYETESFHADGVFDGNHTHLYSVANEYTVKLRVTDNDGAKASDSCTLYAMKVEVMPGDPAWVHVGHNLALDATVTPAVGGGTYSWSPWAGDLTFTPSHSVEDPTLSSDKVGRYRVVCKYTKEGITVSDHSGLINVTRVELFRDSGFSKVLDDWPASGEDPRSPKYIFREENDPIYVKVLWLGHNSDELENIPDAVKVTSASCPGGIYLELEEECDDCAEFKNSLAPDGELLYLSSLCSEGSDRDKIEVIDEEVLTFWLRIPPTGTPFNYVESVSVMVDRAEVAAVDGTDTLDAKEFWTSLVVDRWWGSNGLYDRDNWPTLGDDDKCVELGNESDFMYIAGHCWQSDSPTRIYGLSGYGLQTRGNANNLHVADLPDVPDVPADNTWKRELDWLVLACCSTCYISHTTPRTGPGKEWVDAMDDGGTVHGVMGYEYGAPGGSTPTTDVQLADEFVSALASKTVKNAWIDTNYAEAHRWATYPGWVDSPLNAVAIFRNDNIDDKLGPISSQTLTQDSTQDNFTYYYIYWEESSNPAENYVDQASVEKTSFTYSP